MKKQAFNPYLPLGVCIPDGEPHVFGDRVYIYGSHDKEGGYTFCMLDYTVYSAPVDDLSDWREEGVIYRADQDPNYDKFPYMYAPDVVRGNDGRYYLFYCMSGEYGYGGYTNPISVAVCDTPAGKYEYLGHIKNKDGSLMLRYVCFDPAVMNDDGVIRVFYGTQYDFEEQPDFPNDEYINAEMSMFGRTREEILSYPDSIMGAVMLTLEDDMLTVKDEAKHIIPYKVKGTGFEKHPFFEASSMRKVNGKYYFIYSSKQNHELCYAVSDYPDRDFVFGGTIISNGDIGYRGRKNDDRTNMTGTTHGSIEYINGDWYVFFHRLTHKSDYSRQACAERIKINDDYSIDQVEYTSCGLNGGPLVSKGSYPAPIACVLTNGRMPHGCNGIYNVEFPNVNNIGEDRFIAEIEHGTVIGFKCFDMKSVKTLKVKARQENEGNKIVFTGKCRIDERCIEEIDKMNKRAVDRDIPEVPYLEVRIEEKGAEVGRIEITDDGLEPLNWKEYEGSVSIPDGIYPIFLVYHGKEKLQLSELIFE